MNWLKRYKITEHIQQGFILEHRKTIFSKWNQLLIFNSKTEAQNGIKKHREIRSEYA